MGTQQDDLGPLVFFLPPQLILRSLQSTLRLGYLDDLSLGDRQETVTRDELRQMWLRLLGQLPMIWFPTPRL